MAFPTNFNDETAAQAGEGLHILYVEGVHCKQTEQFLAFMTTFTQNYSSTWNSEVVYGRVDPIATFQGNQRTLSLAWTVPSANLIDAKANLQRFGNLARLIYPSYTEGNTSADGMVNALTLGKPPLIRLSYSNLISSGNPAGLLGYIGNLSWSPDLDMGVFADASAGEVYPKVVQLSLDFTVLHEEVLGWDKSKFRGSTFPFGG